MPRRRQKKIDVDMLCDPEIAVVVGKALADIPLIPYTVEDTSHACLLDVARRVIPEQYCLGAAKDLVRKPYITADKCFESR